jgi:ribosomal protein S8
MSVKVRSSQTLGLVNLGYCRKALTVRVPLSIIGLSFCAALVRCGYVGSYVRHGGTILVRLLYRGGRSGGMGSKFYSSPQLQPLGWHHISQIGAPRHVLLWTRRGFLTGSECISLRQGGLLICQVTLGS